jgi:hypothetical protein
MHRVLLPVLAAFSALLFSAVLLGPGDTPQAGAAPAAWRRRWWLRDPFFWAALLFLAYLALQWWNAGRTPYFDVEMKRWTYTAPRHAGWPWAFTRAEAAQMLYWFFPAWTLGLTARSPWVSRRGLSWMFRGLIGAAGLLALVGVLQYLTRTPAMFWLMPVGCEFFASFAYTNHAAAYFVLMGAVTAGLLFRETFRADRPIAAARVGLFAAILGLCLLGANLSLSRAGVILAWGLASLVAAYGLASGWRRVRPLGKVNLLAATGAAGCVFFLAVSGFGSAAIRNEFAVKRAPIHSMIPALAGINLDLSDRPLLARVATDMWREHAWWGVGGWGFRYLTASYLPETERRYLQIPGRANVHNDPLQFLVEFGGIGGGLMTLALATLVSPLFGRRLARGSVFAMASAGLGLVVVFSLIDLPFRCPAILWTWVLVLASLPKLCTPSAAASQFVTVNR